MNDGHPPAIDTNSGRQRAHRWRDLRTNSCLLNQQWPRATEDNSGYDCIRTQGKVRIGLRSSAMRVSFAQPLKGKVGCQPGQQPGQDAA